MDADEEDEAPGSTAGSNKRRKVGYAMRKRSHKTMSGKTQVLLHELFSFSLEKLMQF